MNLKILRGIILIFSIVALSGGIGYKLGESRVAVNFNAISPNFTVVNRGATANQVADFSMFWNVWDEVSKKYVDKSKLDSQKMVNGAISGMVTSIGDPYTLYLPPTENRQSKEQLNGNFEGIGAELGAKERKIVVVAPLPDSPAERAGVKTGDWIVKVNSEGTENWTLPETVTKIRGPKGTTVTLTVVHRVDEKTWEDKTVDIKIARDNIILKSAEWKEVELSKEAKASASAKLRGKTVKKAAHIKLSRFGDNTGVQWANVVSEVKDYWAKNKDKSAGIVLDVRNNPGGYLAGAVDIASEFLPSGVVVKQVNYRGETLTYSVTRRGELLDVPMVALMNGGTASASEILVGSLQAGKRAKLVGVQSFGKGSVQEAQDLPGGAGLHVTTAKWLLSNDVWINGKGLTPDVKAESSTNPTADLQLDYAILVLNGIKP